MNIFESKSFKTKSNKFDHKFKLSNKKKSCCGKHGCRCHDEYEDDFDEDEEDEIYESIKLLTRNGYIVEGGIDLSDVDNSMTSIFKKNAPTIFAAKSAKEVLAIVEDIFEENDLDTKATRRCLLTLQRQRSLEGAWKVVCNSFLKGTGNGVI